MKLYRCDLCGRVFHEITPHVCVHGNYRKRNLTFTEFEDVDCEYIKKSKVDVKEKSFPNIPQGALTLQERDEPKIEFIANWEHRRYEIAKDAMAGIIANSSKDDYRYEERGCSQNYKYKLQRADIAHRAVLYADALIAELKRKDDGEEV